ncbi:exported hypothetical protein [Candidatus Sulfotelmatobacter sp. SbA7]|nr:exported hypothetical protein [Candidatus Sulfotelmatobacter sp. SbA7]
MKRTIQGIMLAAALMLATCATPALADGPGPPPDGPGPPPTHVSGVIGWSMYLSLIHLL